MENPPQPPEVHSTSTSPAQGEVSGGVQAREATTPSNIIEAADQFREVLRPPTYTRADLERLGCTSVVSPEGTTYVTIPFQAQRKFTEDTKQFGFGAAQAVEHVLKQALTTLGLTGDIQYETDPTSFSFNAWTKPPKDQPAPDTTAPSSSSSSPETVDGLNAASANELSETDAVIAERGKVYGDPELSHENIGLNWTGMIQQHYQVRLPYPLPAWLVELMMAGFKIHRSARVFHEDNYVDLEAYGLKFAREHQRAAFQRKAGQ